MQTLEIPKTGDAIIDGLIVLAIAMLAIMKTLPWLQALLNKPSRSTGATTGVYKTKDGGGQSGDRSNELWEFKIAEIIAEKIQPLTLEHQEHNRLLIEIKTLLTMRERGR